MGSFRDLVCEKSKEIEENPQKIDRRRGERCPVYENFPIFHTRDLENYFTNPPEICVGVVSHALVCAKTFWDIGAALRAFELR